MEVKAGGKRERKVWIARDTAAMYARDCCKWILVVGMGWEWRSTGQSRDVLEKVEQGWAVTQLGSRASQGFPRGAAAADDDGRRLCGVRTKPAILVDAWSCPPNLEQQPATASESRNMGSCCISTDAQDLDSIRFRYIIPKCNGASTIQQVSTWDRSQADASPEHIEHVENTNLPNGLPSPQNAQSPISFDCFLSRLCILLGTAGPGRPFMSAACLLLLHSTSQSRRPVSRPRQARCRHWARATAFFLLLGSPFSANSPRA